MNQSEKLQHSIDEINAKLVAKAGGKVWRATKTGAKKVASGSGEALKRAGVTAQNAIVAGAAAPIGAKVAQSYNQPTKKKDKDAKYSAADVAALAAAMKKSEPLEISEAAIVDKIKGNLADFAKEESQAYLKAKAIIDKANAEYHKSSDLNNIKHPLIGAIKDGIRVFGYVFLSILLGLAFIALYSRHTGSAKQLFNLVLTNVSQNILNDALVLIGFSAGFNKFRQIFSKDSTVSERLSIRASLLEAEAKKKDSDLKKAAKTVGKSTLAGAGVGGAMGAGMAGGLAHKAATTLGATQRRGAGKLIRRAATGLGAAAGGTYGLASGAAKGLIGGAVLAGAAHLYNKSKQAKANKKKDLKEAVDALKAFTEARSKTKPYAQELKKHMKGVGETSKVAKRAAKQAAEKANKLKKAKDIMAGSTAMRNALKKAAIKGGIKGAAITAGLGAAAYGVHKFRNNDQYKY